MLPATPASVIRGFFRTLAAVGGDSLPGLPAGVIMNVMFHGRSAVAEDIQDVELPENALVFLFFVIVVATAGIAHNKAFAD